MIQNTEPATLSTRKRPVIRHSGTERAMEINLAEEERKETPGTAPTPRGGIGG